jgi:F-box and WD-40 domain protein 1/11
MSHHQHGQIEEFFQPILKRDFITFLPGMLSAIKMKALFLGNIPEYILSLLDAKSLKACVCVSKSWKQAVAHGMLWRKLIERKIRTDPIWQGLSERRGWKKFLFTSKEQATYMIALSQSRNQMEAEQLLRQIYNPLEFQHDFYCRLYPQIVEDIERLNDNWCKGVHWLQRINCESENSKGVYCLQYDENKIVSGLRDTTIKIWRRGDLQCEKRLAGHTGSVLCLQYDAHVIVSGSSDSTVRLVVANLKSILNTFLYF